MNTIREQFFQSVDDVIDTVGLDSFKEKVVGTVNDNHTREYYVEKFWEDYGDDIEEWFCGLVGEFQNDDEFQTLFDSYYKDIDNHAEFEGFITKEGVFDLMMVSAITDNL